MYLSITLQPIIGLRIGTDEIEHAMFNQVPFGVLVKTSYRYC